MSKPIPISDRVKFIDVISSGSAYGLIWSGYFDKQPCAVKMVMLTSGYHHDKSKGYRTGDGEKIPGGKKSTPQIFEQNGCVPFLHREFRGRQSMTREAFMCEAKELINLSQLKLAPRVYGYGICDKLFPIHYGFIVMEKMDCSLKDIFLQRSIDSDEFAIVKEAVDTMHHKHQIVHKDMKPSNMGINVDSQGRVKKCLMFDCQKMQHISAMSHSEFDKFVKRDWEIYHKHVKMNRKEGS